MFYRIASGEKIVIASLVVNALVLILIEILDYIGDHEDLAIT